MTLGKNPPAEESACVVYLTRADVLMYLQRGVSLAQPPSARLDLRLHDFDHVAPVDRWVWVANTIRCSFDRLKDGSMGTNNTG